MKKRNVLFITAFGLILTCPLVFSNKVGGEKSESENRYLATFPQLSIHSGLQNEFEAWINDNVGGRDKFKYIYNFVNINVLKSIRDTDNFYKDDWVFSISDTVLGYLQHTDKMDDLQQHDFIENYEKIQKYLLDKGIQMNSIVYPHKSEMYSEKFKGFIEPVNSMSQLDVLEKIAKENENLNLKVTYDDFKLKKESGELLYYKSYDTSHWNNQGAYEGYQLLMKEIQKENPNIMTLTKDNMNVKEEKKIKDYNGKSYVEKDLNYKLKKKNSVPDKEWFDRIGFKSDDMWQSYQYYRNNNEELPKILIVGDSYTWMFMLPWIAESFSETAFIHQLDSNKLPMVIDNLEPNIVIFAGLQNCVTASINDASQMLN